MLVRTARVIVEEGFEDWAGEWRPANPDTLRLVREIVDEHPANAAAYEVANASPEGCPTCVLPERKLFGIAAQVYSLWSEGSAGIGDLVDVATLARHSGADVLLLSPLHLARHEPHVESSPYFPSSRELRDPIYLRVEGVDLPNDPATLIDRDAVWAAKRAALLAQWLAEDERPDFDTWLQGRVADQLAAAATAGAGLIHDIAVGFDPQGHDARRWNDLLANGFTIGAPPDEFNQAGQNWGLPPFVPDKLSAARFRPLAAAFEAAAEHGAGLRIDHVMGLFRLYWIPDGADPADGVYVRYPVRELLDILAGISQRHDTFVVGEDLGTVEPGVREALAARHVLSYKVYWFEDDPPEEWPALSMAAATTHDLPTIVGKGRRVEDVHAALARAASRVVVFTTEDLLGVAEQPNEPGTDAATNWSRRLPRPVSEIVMPRPSAS